MCCFCLHKQQTEVGHTIYSVFRYGTETFCQKTTASTRQALLFLDSGFQSGVSVSFG